MRQQTRDHLHGGHKELQVGGDDTRLSGEGIAGLLQGPLGMLCQQRHQLRGVLLLQQVQHILHRGTQCVASCLHDHAIGTAVKPWVPSCRAEYMPCLDPPDIVREGHYFSRQGHSRSCHETWSIGNSGGTWQVELGGEGRSLRILHLVKAIDK